MFAVLDRFDIALAHAHARNREETKTVCKSRCLTRFPR